MASKKAGKSYNQPEMVMKTIPDPFPEKDPDDLITIKVKHLRQLIRLEYAVLSAMIDGQRVIPSDIMSVYEELGAMREVEE